LFARRNADVRIFPYVPLLPDFCFISRGIVYTVIRARVFADAVTDGLMAGMFVLIFASVLMA
jgi:hypothetical protein